DTSDSLLAMLGGQGIQPVTVQLSNSKNCFLHLPPALISNLSLHETQVLELCWGQHPPVYLSWTRCGRRSSYQEENTVELNRQLGDKLGIRDGEQAFLRPCQQVLSVQQVFVEPLSSDDWEILELHSSVLEQKLLDQIRVVFPSGIFPVWVDQHTVIFIRIGSLSPPVVYGRLEQCTELVVSPKSRGDRALQAVVHPDSACTPGTSQIQSLHQWENLGVQALKPFMGSDPVETIEDHLQDRNEHPNHGSWGGITDLRSLVRYMFTGSFNPRKEVPKVPSIPLILRDCILRVSGHPPPMDTHKSRSQGTVHVLPWSVSEVYQGGQEPVVTYGWLTRLCSPWELREDAQRASEKKKVGEDSPSRDNLASSDEDQPEPLVVEIVCHCEQELLKEPSSGRGTALYSGSVWIPKPLRRRLNIELHSAVRIQPLKSTPRIALALRLQPLQSLVRHLFVSFVLTKGEAFWYSPCSVDLNVFHMPSLLVLLITHAHVHLFQHRGVKDVGRAAFEHISHSLMAGPLSQELLCSGQGLRSGAVLITGPKGSGKTSLAKALCRKSVEDLDAHIEVIYCKTLKGKRVETVRRRLEEVFEQAAWREPAVVLLDDLDHMAGAASSLEHERGPEAIRSLHKAMLNGSLVAVIGTSLSEHSLHPSLVEMQGSHLFQYFTSLQSPDLQQRVEILSAVLHSRTALSPASLRSLCLEDVARETEGWQPRDLTLLVERAIHLQRLEPSPVLPIFLPDLHLSIADFQQGLKGFKPPSLWQARLNSPGGAGLEQVGGLREVRQVLMDTILLPAKYPTLFSRLPIRHRSGVLLYGAPGTGKTLLAGAVARESSMNFISIKGPELLSKYIGASEQAVRDLFQRAQSAKPCILFFDEFDSLAPRRGHDSTGVTDRVVNQLLTQLDGVEGLQGVYVLAATSRPDLIDPALLRPGRLDKCLYSRLEILQALTRSIALAADVDLEQLASATECFTGADLKALLYNAQLEAVGVLSTDLGSGSDSDASLSSMIFLNQSSGSDDSAGEGEGGLEQSMVLLEPGEAGIEDPRQNVWRLYFGSSYESELGNPSPSDLNSQCLSGPNSVTHDLTGASLRDPGNLAAPAFMASLQEGFQELSQEKLERLRTEISCIKANLRGRNMEESVLPPAEPSKPAFVICQAHLSSALSGTRASISLFSCTHKCWHWLFFFLFFFKNATQVTVNINFKFLNIHMM
uniref:Peroxisomal ATPase PEX1 n=1 Tax=Scleropages formosus TaxID=113540 RepID=A0A8C9U728_SCLFO